MLLSVGWCGSVVVACLLAVPTAVHIAHDDAQGDPDSAQAASATAQPEMEIYGFTEADAISDVKQNNPDWFDVNRPSQLPAFSDEFGRNGHFYLSPRHSRFGVTASIPTSKGDVQATFEIDMVGTGPNAGRTTIRLRHAWGQWKQIGAGQTFSQFMDPDVYPNRLDFWGPNGMLTTRAPQIFWQPYRAGDSHVRVSLERPGATADGESFADHIQLRNVALRLPMPDIAGHYRQATSWGYVQIGGTIRYIAFDDIPEDQFDLSGHVWGWGLGLSSNVKPAPGDLLRLEVAYGHGIENEINDAPIDVGPRLNPGNPRTPVVGEALPVWAMVAYLDHSWTDRWSTTAGYSRVDIDNSSGQTPLAFRVGQYATVNAVCLPVPKVLMGGELQWARRENFSDGFSVDDLRLAFTFRYSFRYPLGTGH